MFNNFLDSLFPSRVRQRELLKREQMLTCVLEREIATAFPQFSDVALNPKGALTSASVKESSQFLGNPWQFDMAGMSLDQAYKLGYPIQGTGYYTDAEIAHDDTVRNEILRQSRHLYTNHPHAKGMIDACKAFVCGATTWTVEPTPKHPDLCDENKIETVTESDADKIDPVGDDVAGVPEEPKLQGGTEKIGADVEFNDRDRIDHALARKIKKLWLKHLKRGNIHPQMGWVQFWTEAYMRTRRDGECFIYYGNNRKTGSITPRFLEPEDIVPPLGTVNSVGIFDPKTNGVEVDPDDTCTVVGYWWKRGDKITAEPEFIPAERVDHIKFGVDSGIKRGLPMLYVCRQYLKHFDLWIAQSLRHQRIQSMTAVLRQWQNAPEAVLSNLINNKTVQSRAVTTPAGNTITQRTTDMPPVLDAPQGMEMKPFVPSGNYSDSEILARRVLLACAVGANLSEAMVTADGSNANYSSTRITQFIPMRAFEAEQGFFGEYIESYYRRWVKTEAALKRLPPLPDEDQHDCNVSPARLPDFEGEIATTTVSQQYKDGLLSRRSAQEKLGIDPDTEDERMEKEESSGKQNAQNAAMEMLGLPPGAAPDNAEQPAPSPAPPAIDTTQQPGGIPSNDPEAVEPVNTGE